MLSKYFYIEKYLKDTINEHNLNRDIEPHRKQPSVWDN